jgi:hypothetical protein
MGVKVKRISKEKGGDMNGKRYLQAWKGLLDTLCGA